MPEFDVVVGNPPYNETTDSGHHSTKQRGGKNLWISFFEKSKELLKRGGYIAFVTPNHWIRPQNGVKESMLSGRFVWAEVSSIKKHFNVGSTFTAWVWSRERGEHNICVDGFPIDICQELVPVGTSTIDDWRFLARDFRREPITWRRTAYVSEMRQPCVVVERASPMKKTYLWDGSTKPSGDWYYHNFDCENDAADVLNFLKSEDGQRILSLVRSGAAMTHIINKIPVLSK